MEQYIPKSVVLAEIERRKSELQSRIAELSTFESNTLGLFQEMELYDDIISFLNFLEVKEVDLEKYYHDFLQKEWFDKNCSRTVSEMMAFTAKHFFELGLKAQHDNWKVVDNTNIPQADRNKIYCVFTKQKYILAKVINNPQDEELLQWKCTEFPYHRYDMYEGDKYMQIV